MAIFLGVSHHYYKLKQEKIMYTSHLSSQATVYELRTELQNLIAEDNL